LDAAGKSAAESFPLRAVIISLRSSQCPERGDFERRLGSVPAHNGIRDAGLPKPTDDGTTFLVTEGAARKTARRSSR